MSWSNRSDKNDKMKIRHTYSLRTSFCLFDLQLRNEQNFTAFENSLMFLSINNTIFENDLGQMYSAESEIKNTPKSATSAFYLYLLLSIGSDGQLHSSMYDKQDDFNFHITSLACHDFGLHISNIPRYFYFPFLSSNIPSSPAYGVFISQPIRYAWACSSY